MVEVVSARTQLRRVGRMVGRALPRPARVRGIEPAGRRAAEPPRAPARAPGTGHAVLRALPVGVARRGAGPGVPERPRSWRGGLPRLPARAGAPWGGARLQGAR